MVQQAEAPSWSVLAGTCLLALGLHLPVLGLSFFSDDFSILYRLGVLGDLGTGSFFRPLPDWTLYVNHVIAGPTPWAFRLVNVLLLGINGWAVFLLGRALLQRMDRHAPGTPLFAALLFVVYPFHNEPQLWVIGRGIAMATTCILAGLIIALSRMGAMRKVVGVGLASMLGALCYESALLLPALLLALWPVIAKEERPTWLLLVLTSAALVALNLIARGLFTGHVANDYGYSFFMDPSALPLRGLKTLARLFLPPHSDERTQLLRALVLAIGLLVIGSVYWYRTKDHPSLRHTFVVLVGSLAVSCAIGALAGVSTRTSESDRFLYLPSVFTCLLIALTIGTLARGKASMFLIGLLCCVSLLALQHNHANWKTASRTIASIVHAAPRAGTGARVHVHGLPGDHQGAFIFRHGFHEALLYAGRDTTGLVRADTLLWGLANSGHLPALSFEDREDTLIIRPEDRIMTWNGTGFVAVPHGLR